MPKNAQTATQLRSSHMLKILQARLQQYMICELPDVQAGVRKGRGTGDQIANIHWIIKKAREFQKKSISALLTMLKPLCGSPQTMENSETDGNTRPLNLLPDLHTDFSRGRSGGLVFPSLEEISTVCGDPHSQRLWHSQ